MENTALPYTYLPDLHTLVTDIPADSIVSRTIHKDARLNIILFAFAPDQILSEHSTPLAATLYFVQGEAELTLGQDTVAAQTGTWVQMPPRLAHSIRAKTELLMLLTMIRSD
ncbi:MAG TPA: cupin domain-containing protein [Anaerolineae bacterium]|nr:cupin domain-containing protein [Anaerolineae bacterium]